MRMVALGNPDRGDDGAALLVASRFVDDPRVVVVLAGRPGVDLLNLLPARDRCLLMDVTWSDSPPGTIHRLPLNELDPAVLPDLRVSSHGFGPGEALCLARALGNPLPHGLFLGLEGQTYHPGHGLSPEVRRALPKLEKEVHRFLGAG